VAATWYGSSRQACNHLHWVHAHVRHVLDHNFQMRTPIELKFSLMSLQFMPLGVSYQLTSNSKSHFFSKLRVHAPIMDTCRAESGLFCTGWLNHGQTGHTDTLWVVLPIEKNSPIKTVWKWFSGKKTNFFSIHTCISFPAIPVTGIWLFNHAHAVLIGRCQGPNL